MLMGLVAAAVLAQGDMIKSLAMVVIGLLLGIVGTDVNTGTQRFTSASPSSPTASASSWSRSACSRSARSSAIWDGPPSA